MRKRAIATVSPIIANAAGLLLAAWLLDGSRIDAASFIVVLLVFTGIMLLTNPVPTKIAETSLPQTKGGTALVSDKLHI